LLRRLLAVAAPVGTAPAHAALVVPGGTRRWHTRTRRCSTSAV